MAQTEGMAFRKCVEQMLARDETVIRLLPGGVWLDEALPTTPYPLCVVDIVTMPSEIGDDRRRVFVQPLIRVQVYAEGRDSHARSVADRAGRRLDTILETLRFTATDEGVDGEPDEPIEIRGFFRESGIDRVETDPGTGTLYTVVGGDYRGFGYRLPTG